MLSLYVHIPFCVKKCHYCGFYSTTYSSQSADQYLQALESEAKAYQSVFAGRTLDTVYIGGGTPSVLSTEQLLSLTTIIKMNFQISEDVEWTVEANPNSISKQQLAFLHKEQVNRLSLGVQSFDDAILQILGRLHTAQEARDAFRMARRAGFTNIGIDLIYGIPGQSTDQWNATLDGALLLHPEHISVYSLSLDEGARFKKEADAGRIKLPDDEFVVSLYEIASDRLCAASYERYEISNFALAGRSCRHNKNYWSRGEYIGLGPGAWSFISGKRYHNVADVREYVALGRAGQPLIRNEETVVASQAADETIMLSLRTSQGLDLSAYENTFGRDATQRLRRNAASLQRFGLVTQTDGQLRLTTRGILLADEALARLCS